MKILISVMIAIVLIFSLAACGSTATEPQPTSLPTATPAPVPTPTPEPTPAPAPKVTEELVEPEPEPELSPDVIEEPVEESSARISPELIEFLESYESFIDEYCDFMKKYMENPTDLNLLMKYSAILSEYSKFTQAVDNYDTSTMNEAESLYFAEVTLRCSQKLLKALG